MEVAINFGTRRGCGWGRGRKKDHLLVPEWTGVRNGLIFKQIYQPFLFVSLCWWCLEKKAATPTIRACARKREGRKGAGKDKKKEKIEE